MPIDPEKVISARKASGLSLESAADAVELSKQGYINREKQPDQFRLCELEGLYKKLNDTARPILAEAVSEIFLPA